MFEMAFCEAWAKNPFLQTYLLLLTHDEVAVVVCAYERNYVHKYLQSGLS